MNPIIFLTPVALLILSVVLSVILVKKGARRLRHRRPRRRRQ